MSHPNLLTFTSILFSVMLSVTLLELNTANSTKAEATDLDQYIKLRGELCDIRYFIHKHHNYTNNLMITQQEYNNIFYRNITNSSDFAFDLKYIPLPLSNEAEEYQKTCVGLVNDIEILKKGLLDLSKAQKELNISFFCITFVLLISLILRVLFGLYPTRVYLEKFADIVLVISLGAVFVAFFYIFLLISII